MPVLRRPRSVTGTVTLMSIAVGLSIALLVGWTLVIVNTLSLPANAWLLVAGIVSFVVIMTVLLLSGVALITEILEVRRQNSFIDSVTHELKSPLASLRLCLETLSRDGLDPAHSREVRDMMLHDVERLSAFIDDVLAASQLTTGHEGLPLTRIDLPALVRSCVAQVTARYPDASHRVELRIADDTALLTDSVALEIILKNLLDNAFKYSADGVDVTVSAMTRAPQVLEVQVTDRGIGIPRDDLKRVFKRFYRVEKEDVRERRGTGLGLYVAQVLARNLGGRLRAESAGPSAGTTMSLTLPLAGAGPRHPLADERRGESDH